MMKVDTSAFLGHWPFRPIEGTPADLGRMMRANGIAHVVLSPLEGLFYIDPEPANAALLCQIAERRNLWAAPILSLLIPDWQEQLDALAGNAQVRAVRVAPTFDGYEVKACAAAAKAAAERDLTLIVQLRMEDERHHTPVLNLPPASVSDAVDVAAAARRSRVVVSAARLPELLEVSEKAAHLPNLWFDISHFDGLDCIQRACQAVGARRLLFSTSWPFFYARSAVLKVEEAEIPAQRRQALLGGNARRAFALPRR